MWGFILMIGGCSWRARGLIWSNGWRTLVTNLRGYALASHDKIEVEFLLSYGPINALINRSLPKHSKTEKGSKITLLGVTIDLQEKTAKITDQKAQNIEKDAELILTTGQVTSRQLAIFYGRLEFASTTCQVGRVHTKALTDLMGDMQTKTLNSLSDWDEITLSLEALEEVRFWKNIRSHKPLNIGPRENFNGLVLASDASSKKWAYTIGNSSFADSYPAEIAKLHITCKEAFALFKLVEKSATPNSDLTVLCDNQPCVKSFNKKRSSNPVIHELIKKTYKTLANMNSRLRVTWISTGKMEELADGPSRGRYKRDDFGLSQAGLAKLKSLAPGFSRRVQEGGCISLFAGPENNPANIRYFSLDIDAQDPLNAGESAFEALARRKSKGQGLVGGVLAYPPIQLIDSFNKEMRAMGLEPDTEIFYILPAFKVQSTLNALIGIGQLRVFAFGGKNNKTLLHRKLTTRLSLIIISNEERTGPSESKRSRREY